ncbi:MAG: flippase-like domain-containing protein, partial [Erysipelotrichia bacterium]|nr:flippase-like domain-containing protein [Erysipelotrichia bacterium]
VFYSAITPGSSGGQVMQAYTYKTQGVHISSAISILAMYSIVFQSILIVFDAISFFVKYDFITSLGHIPTSISINDVPLNFPVWPLTILGFLLNVGVIAIVFLMGYWRGFHNFIMGPVVDFLHKIKLISNPDRQRESLRIQVENFKIEFSRLRTNIPFIILVVVSFIFYMALKFCIPYFVGKSLGNLSPSASFWDSIFLSNYHQMITGLIPLPGSAGISEFVFYNLFMNEKNLTAGFFCAYRGGVPNASATRSLVRAALVIWRSTTFVIPILIGGMFAAFYRSSARKTQPIGYLPDRHTFVSLQKETYAQRYEEVALLIETSRLSREAILEKLRPKKKKKVAKKPRKDPPANISKPDYDEVILDDIEGGK